MSPDSRGVAIRDSSHQVLCSLQLRNTQGLAYMVYLQGRLSWFTPSSTAWGKFPNTPLNTLHTSPFKILKQEIKLLCVIMCVRNIVLSSDPRGMWLMASLSYPQEPTQSLALWKYVREGETEGLTWAKSEGDKLTRQREDRVEGYQGHTTEIKHHLIISEQKDLCFGIFWLNDSWRSLKWNKRGTQGHLKTIARGNKRVDYHF